MITVLALLPLVTSLATAHNPTGIASGAHRAQPCIRLADYTATQPVMHGSFDLWFAEGRPHIDFGGWPMAAPLGTPRLDDGQWHHVSFVWNQNDGKRAMHLFIDGTPAPSGNGPENGSTDKLSVGVSNHLQGQAFIGNFDEIRIYQRTLTVEEITALATKDRTN
jgi:Concanavalin A-like lectin/glucanases superfamily